MHMEWNIMLARREDDAPEVPDSRGGTDLREPAPNFVTFYGVYVLAPALGFSPVRKLSVPAFRVSLLVLAQVNGHPRPDLSLCQLVLGIRVQGIDPDGQTAEQTVSILLGLDDFNALWERSLAPCHPLRRRPIRGCAPLARLRLLGHVGIALLPGVRCLLDLVRGFRGFRHPRPRLRAEHLPRAQQTPCPRGLDLLALDGPTLRRRMPYPKDDLLIAQLQWHGHAVALLQGGAAKNVVTATTPAPLVHHLHLTEGLAEDTPGTSTNHSRCLGMLGSCFMRLPSCRFPATSPKSACKVKQRVK